MSEELPDDAKRRYDENLRRVDTSEVKPIDLTDDPRPGVTDVMFENPGDLLVTPTAPPSGPVGDAFSVSFDTPATAADALTVTIDASIDLQDTHDSGVDSAFAPLPGDAREAQRDEALGDDGF